MITLVDFFDAAMLPMRDMETGENIDSKVVLAHPNAIVEKIGWDNHKYEFTVLYEKEPEDAEND